MGILAQYMDELKLKSKLAEFAASSQANPEFDKARIEAEIKNKIFGQEDIIREIVNHIYNESLRERRDHPVARYMIAGPSGTGKSMLGKVLGETLYGKNGFVTFNMATANNMANANAIFGAPTGYQGGDRTSPSISHIINYPRCVVIVDEIEKTTREVQQRFLEPLEDGVMTNVSTGEKVDVTQTIFIFTTNALQEQCAKVAANQQANVQQISKECDRLLRSVFDQALMSRLDMVFAFQPLNDFALCELVGSKIIKLIEAYPMQLAHIDIEVLARWVQKYQSTHVDGRDVSNDVKRTISARLNELKLQGVQRVKLVDKKGELVIDKA